MVISKAMRKLKHMFLVFISVFKGLVEQDLSKPGKVHAFQLPGSVSL